MRSLLFSVDHVYREDGSLTPLELNTATGTDFAQGSITVENFTSSVDGFYDHAALHSYMSSSNLTKLDVIAPTGSEAFFNRFAEYYGYEYTCHATSPTDVTIPFVEDEADKLIIRVAYNTYAIVDDLYARDNYEFHNLISSESFASPVTFATNSFDTINTYEAPTTASNPNYIIKARFPEYDPHTFPKVYSLENNFQLDGLKSTLASDEFIQKYEFNPTSGITDERVRFLRSLNLAFGDDLSEVMNLSNYSKSNQLSLTNQLLITGSQFDSDRLMDKLSSAKFYPTYYVKHGFHYHNDEDDLVLTHTGSLLDFEEVQANTLLQGIEFSGQFSDYKTGSLSDLATASFYSSSVKGVGESSGGGIFANISASAADNTNFSWHDGYGNMYLTYRDGAIIADGAEAAYLHAGELEIGDKVYVYKRSTNSFEWFTISSIMFDFKNLTTSLISIDPGSQFFVQIPGYGGGDFYLLQHNMCLAGCTQDATCGMGCTGCGKFAKLCIDCGGGDTQSCGGPPKCFMEGSLITMADGSFKPIEEVKQGEYVQSRNGNIIVKEAHTYKVGDHIKIYSNNNLKVTFNHPMFIDGKWSTAEDLNWKSNLEFVDKLYNLVTDDSFIVEGVFASGTAQDHLNVVVDEKGISRIIENKKTA